MKISIVTDSSADIPGDIASRNNIAVVPMYIGYDGDLYKEGKEINTERSLMLWNPVRK